VHDRAQHPACPANCQRGRAHRPPPAFRLHRHPGPRGDAEPIRHWVAVRQRGTLLAASTLRCRGDYQSAAAAIVLIAGQLTSRGDPLPGGVLVPEEVLTIGELEPGLAEAGITVVEEPTADRSGPARASQSRTGGRELSGRERGCRSAGRRFRALTGRRSARSRPRSRWRRPGQHSAAAAGTTGRYTGLPPLPRVPPGRRQRARACPPLRVVAIGQATPVLPGCPAL
jgi:hypothetical protein